MFSLLTLCASAAAAPPGIADLTISDLDFIHDAASDLVWVDVEITNDGDNISKDFDLGVYRSHDWVSCSDVEESTHSTDGLDPGQSVTVRHLLKGVTGPEEVYFFVDVADNSTESDEENNELVLNITADDGSGGAFVGWTGVTNPDCLYLHLKHLHDVAIPRSAQVLYGKLYIL